MKVSSFGLCVKDIVNLIIRSYAKKVTESAIFFKFVSSLTFFTSSFSFTLKTELNTARFDFAQILVIREVVAGHAVFAELFAGTGLAFLYRSFAGVFEGDARGSTLYRNHGARTLGAYIGGVALGASFYLAGDAVACIGGVGEIPGGAAVAVGAGIPSLAGLAGSGRRADGAASHGRTLEHADAADLRVVRVAGVAQRADIPRRAGLAGRERGALVAVAHSRALHHAADADQAVAGRAGLAGRLSFALVAVRDRRARQHADRPLQLVAVNSVAAVAQSALVPWLARRAGRRRGAHVALGYGWTLEDAFSADLCIVSGTGVAIRT